MKIFHEHQKIETAKSSNTHEGKKLNLNHGGINTFTLLSQCGSEYSQEISNMHMQSAFKHVFLSKPMRIITRQL